MHPQQPTPAPAAVAPDANAAGRAGVPRWLIFVAAGMVAAAMLGPVAMCGVGALVFIALHREKAVEEEPPGEKWRIVGGQERSVDEKRRLSEEGQAGEAPEGPVGFDRSMPQPPPGATPQLERPAPTHVDRVEDGWTIRHEPAARFRAAFPASPTASDPLGLISPQAGMPAESQRAMLEQLGMRAVAATVGDRKYSVVAMPLPLDDATRALWLDAVDQTLQLQYREFTVEPVARGEAGSRAYRDFVVRSESEIKLIRMTSGEGFIYTISIEGAAPGAGLTFDDPIAIRFFAAFEPL